MLSCCSGWLMPRYARQKDFYNKAIVYEKLDNYVNEFTLQTDHIKYGFVTVAKIVNDKKHKSKSRFYITTDKKLLNDLSIKHIYDFIFQYYKHNKTLNKMLRRGVFQKQKVFEYALPLE